MINPGELRYPVELYSLVNVKDAYGYSSEIYVYQSSFKCKVVVGNGNKGITNDELFNTSFVSFITYYRTIKTTDRIRYNGQDYIINSINPIDYRSGIVIECELLQGGLSEVGVLTGTTIIISGGGTSGTSGIGGSETGGTGSSGTSGKNSSSGTSGSGSPGSSGTSGNSGQNGTSGTSGSDGTSGISGTSGNSGTSGISGSSGTSGLTGTSGTSGSSGKTGSSGTSGTSGGGSSDDQALYIDTINHKTGFGTLTPTEKIDIVGNFNITGTTTTAGIIKQGGAPLIHSYGTDNFFVGKNAGNTTLTTSQQNTCIGTQSGRLFDTTSYNTAVGYQSLFYSATNAGENSAFGRMSLMYATGSYNSGLGNTSLGGASFSGSYNVGIGKDAGRGLSTGGHNTFIGYASGHVNQSATALFSMALGDQAYTTKSYQVVLGATNITETVLRPNVLITSQTGLTSSSVLDIDGNEIRIRTSQTPTSATATGNPGEICWDSNYIYVCTATNTWKRVAIATW